MTRCRYCHQIKCGCGAQDYIAEPIAQPAGPDLSDLTELVWGTDINGDYFYTFFADSAAAFSFHIPKAVFYQDLANKYKADPYQLSHAIHLQLARLCETEHDVEGAYALVCSLDRGELPKHLLPILYR